MKSISVHLNADEKSKEGLSEIAAGDPKGNEAGGGVIIRVQSRTAGPGHH